MKIISKFLINGEPKKRLKPKIKIIENDTKKTVVNNGEMTESVDGIYFFDFCPGNKEYSVIVDGGGEVDDSTRIQYSIIEKNKEVKIEINEARKDNKFLTRIEKRLQNRLKKIWKKQMEWIIDHFLDFWILQNSIKKNQSAQEIDVVLRDMPGTTDLADELLMAEALAIKKGANSIIQALKLATFGISFTLKHPDAVRYLRTKHTLEKLSNYRGNIDGTTKSAIRDIIVKGISEGTSYTELANLIRKQGDTGVFSQARGEHIAQREMGLAYSHGNRIPIDEFARKHPDRQVHKRWNTVGGGIANRVRETHTQNESDGWIPLNQMHSGTGEDKAPSAQFRCRCTETYQII